MRDPYRVLGVSPDATEEEIRRAHRAAARREHPDVSGHEDAAERMAELNEAYAAVGDPEARAETSPPAGWARPPEPAPPRKRRRRLRRLGRVVLGLTLLAAMIGVAVLAVLYVRDEHQATADVAVAATLAEVTVLPPAERDSVTEQEPLVFTTDGEGCMLWRQYELQAARSVETLRDGIALARVGPDDDAERRRRVREVTPQLNAATLQLRDARDVVRGQERDAGIDLPWQAQSVALHRAAQGLRAYFRQHARPGTMPRRAAPPVVAALAALDDYDAIVRELDEDCS